MIPPRHTLRPRSIAPITVAIVCLGLGGWPASAGTPHAGYRAAPPIPCVVRGACIGIDPDQINHDIHPDPLQISLSGYPVDASVHVYLSQSGVNYGAGLVARNNPIDVFRRQVTSGSHLLTLLKSFPAHVRCNPYPTRGGRTTVQVGAKGTLTAHMCIPVTTKPTPGVYTVFAVVALSSPAMYARAKFTRQDFAYHKLIAR